MSDRPSAQLSGAEAAAAIAELLADGDVLWAAATEADASAIAAALAVAAPGAQVVHVPESDALLGSDLPASRGNVGRRTAALAALAALPAERPAVALVTTADALAHAWPAPGEPTADAMTLRVGEAADLAALHEAIVALGYIDDDRVDEPGEVALRGQVLDVFPAQADDPVRIEAEDGRIDAISLYDVIDQLSVSQLTEVTLASAVEPRAGGPAGSLLDHLPAARLVLGDAVAERRRALQALAAEIEKDGARPVRSLLPEDAWTAALKGREILEPAPDGEPPPHFVENRRPESAFRRAVAGAIDAGERIVLLGSARDLRFLARRAERLLQHKVVAAGSWHEVQGAPAGSVMSLPMPAERGFRRRGVLAIAAADLLGSRAGQAAGTPAVHPGLPEPGGIRIGDVVVHEDHGIGVVQGLDEIPATGDTPPGAAIRLGYAKDATRLVPVDQANLLWRYGAEPEAVTLDRLDGDSWRKRRAEVSAAVDEAAAALLDLAAARQEASAPALSAAPAEYERFAAGFPFAPTPDQHRAFQAVADDLASGRPMDRLVIGDVGFGKTEIALRAAAIAVLAGKQVAVAAPTTVLARQHFETFERRFAGLGIAVGSLTGLQSESERRRVRAGLADGTIRIAVGTGAIAGKGVAYDDLGLVVIDEEQRLGAADKQKLRGLGASHVLTMTATPIPRTLQAALIGLQPMSVLATPPARRQPIRTSLDVFDPATLRAALLREKSHGGQSFVVVPRIADMEPLAAELARAVPELSVLRAHGKLPAAEIDDTMIRFANGDGDVLLATNIVEAGLDVPRANTMIVCNADSFGLAQLHQLRGRVGRGARRGHMLMLTEPGKELAPATARRLQTLEVMNRLGAGFDISARDLDLRGAGDLVGDDQTGHIKLIGVDLYQQMLAAALAAIRGEDSPRRVPEVQFGLAAFLPETWIADPDTRLEIYIRIARLDGADAAELIADELEDRFGAIPPEAANLLALARLRIAARGLGLERVAAGPKGIVLGPGAGHGIDAGAAGLVAKDDCLVRPEEIDDPLERLRVAEEMLRTLAPPPEEEPAPEAG